MSIILGREFGRLKVVSKFDKKYFVCVCSCGTKKKVRKDHLTSGKTRSCGCLHSELSSKRCHKLHKLNTKHGQSNSRAHRIWSNMKQRCYNQNNNAYSYYGGRGISVCKRWHLFENFLFDMGDPPKGYTIDRIDNNGNYEPSNCRWVSRKVQQNNRRVNHKITHDGITLTVAQWADRLGIPASTLDSRIRSGWTVETALLETSRSTKVASRRFKMFEHDGKSMTIPEWADHLNIKPKTLYERLRKGWPIERVFSSDCYINQYK